MTHEIKVGQHGEGCECPHCSIYWPYAHWKEADQTKCETLRKKKPSFRLQYFSGLNWREALEKGLVGREVEFSRNGDSWCTGWLTQIKDSDCTENRFVGPSGLGYTYIRTTPQTHAHPTITIGGAVLSRPEIEAPEEGTLYWVWRPEQLCSPMWKKDSMDKNWLAAGMVHLTESRAQEWADWWNNTIIKTVNS